MAFRRIARCRPTPLLSGARACHQSTERSGKTRIGKPYIRRSTGSAVCKRTETDHAAAFTTGFRPAGARCHREARPTNRRTLAIRFRHFVAAPRAATICSGNRERRNRNARVGRKRQTCCQHAPPPRQCSACNAEASRTTATPARVAPCGVTRRSAGIAASRFRRKTQLAAASSRRTRQD